MPQTWVDEARKCAVPLPTIESQTHSLSSEPSDAVSARPGQGGIRASDVLLLQALEAGDDDIDAARLAAARVRQCDPTRHPLLLLSRAASNDSLSTIDQNSDTSVSFANTAPSTVFHEPLGTHTEGFVCPRCGVAYSTSDAARVPRLLHCLHAICTQCAPSQVWIRTPLTSAYSLPDHLAQTWRCWARCCVRECDSWDSGARIAEEKLRCSGMRMCRCVHAACAEGNHHATGLSLRCFACGCDPNVAL